MGSGCSSNSVQVLSPSPPTNRRSISSFTNETQKLDELHEGYMEEFKSLRDASLLFNQKSRAEIGEDQPIQGDGGGKSPRGARLQSHASFRHSDWGDGGNNSGSTTVDRFGPFDVVPLRDTHAIELVGREFQGYIVCPPTHISSLLQDCIMLGRVSQWCNVRAYDPLYHNNTIIPTKAVHYAFAYPLASIPPEATRMLDLADTLSSFLLNGGFIYVDDKFTVVAIFSLRPAIRMLAEEGRDATHNVGRTSSTLHFSPPYRIFENTSDMIITEDRLSRVTQPELVKEGYYFMAWLPPGYATLTHPCPHGAIA
eukprot:PhF_6_TR42622/c0_g1_i2/m.64064